jgi:hypothetical protein
MRRNGMDKSKLCGINKNKSATERIWYATGKMKMSKNTGHFKPRTKVQASFITFGILIV